MPVVADLVTRNDDVLSKFSNGTDQAIANAGLMDDGALGRSRASTAAAAAAARLVVVSDAPFRASKFGPPETLYEDDMKPFFKEPDFTSDLSSPAEDLGLGRLSRPRTGNDHDDEYDDRFLRDDDGPPGQITTTPGHTVRDLVDRLLAPPATKADANFSIIFFCLYRKFAAPGEVLGHVLARFYDADDSDGQSTGRTSAQLRLLSVLLQWLVSYPGDFAYPPTRRRVHELVATLPSSQPYANAAKDLRAALEVFIEDDDAIWARSDLDPSSRGIAYPPSSPTDAAIEEIDGRMRQVSVGTDDSVGFGGGGVTSARVSGVPSQSSSGDNSTTLSEGSSSTLLNTVEIAEREAQTLVPTPRTRLTKVLWRQFMEIRDEDFAQELTRIDWVMFSAIRPRDIVRHITLSAAKRERSKSVENVNRMINHFNHLACWVTNMILLRDKAKHRARALEKFMDIAWVSLRSRGGR